MSHGHRVRKGERMDNNAIRKLVKAHYVSGALCRKGERAKALRRTIKRGAKAKAVRAAIEEAG